MKFIERLKAKDEREIMLLGFPLLQYGKVVSAGVEKKYFNLLPIRTFVQNVFEKILSIVPDSVDDIYITRYTTGENRIFSLFLNSWIKKNKSKNPAVVCLKDFHRDVIELYNPDITTLTCDIDWKNSKMLFKKPKHEFRYKGHRIFLYIDQYYSDKYFKEILSNKNYHHYYEEIKKYIFNDLEYSNIRPTISEEVKKSMLEKVNKTGLCLDKFVIIAPEASTVRTLDYKFWNVIIELFNKNGFDVFLNLTGDTAKNYLGSVKTTDLSIKEVVALSQYSKGAIGVRSGLLELFLEQEIKIVSIYNSLKNIKLNAQQALMCWSLEKLPNVYSNVKECIFNEKDFDNLVFEISNFIMGE